MKALQRVAELVLLLSFGMTMLYAGEKKEKFCCEKSACAKMLKGVTHLTDNDLRFQTKEGRVIFIDPMSGPKDSLVTALGLTQADIILITHSHGDHYQPDIVKAYLENNPKLKVAGPADVAEDLKEKGISNVLTVIPNEKYIIGGISVETVPAYFVKWDSHPKEKGWVGYVLNVNDHRYFITGDTESNEEMKSVKADAIFPLVYGCGGNVDDAVKMSKLSGASLVVPSHTGGRVEIIKKFIGMLPEKVASAYYINGKLIEGQKKIKTVKK